MTTKEPKEVWVVEIIVLLVIVGIITALRISMLDK